MFSNFFILFYFNSFYFCNFSNSINFKLYNLYIIPEILFTNSFISLNFFRLANFLQNFMFYNKYNFISKNKMSLITSYNVYDIFDDYNII